MKTLRSKLAGLAWFPDDQYGHAPDLGQQRVLPPSQTVNQSLLKRTRKPHIRPALATCGLALLTVLAATAQAQDYSYVTNNGTITIARYTGPGGAVTIPSTIDGLPFTSIGNAAFSWCTSLTSAYFEGNAPGDGGDMFHDPNNVTVHYLPGTTGWGSTFSGRPTALWILPQPVILTTATGFGVQPGGYGFRISWATNTPVVVEVSTSLSNPDWSPVATNTLVNGWSDFRDPNWVNHPKGFYRVHTP